MWNGLYAMKKIIGVLVSNKGTGSNLKAIIDAGFKVKLVIADREEAAGIEISKKNKIPSEIIPYKKPEELSSEEYRDNYSKEVASILNKYKINFAILAGFNRILTKPYFENFKEKTINIHPGAVPENENEIIVHRGMEIPWNQGMLTDMAVANFLPLKYASSTVHIVTEKADFGLVLKRAFVKVKKNDTVETLYSRLKKAEHKALIGVLKKI